MESLPLNERPQLIALNKTDLPDGQAMAEMVRGELEGRGWRVFEVSAVARQGLRELGFAMAELVEAARAQRETEHALVQVTVRPKPVDEKGFSISREEKNAAPLWRVRGAKPERWIHQTDFNNDEAVGYLADRLAAIGIEDELFKQGPPQVTQSSSAPTTTGWSSTGSPPWQPVPSTSPVRAAPT